MTKLKKLLKASLLSAASLLPATAAAQSPGHDTPLVYGFQTDDGFLSCMSDNGRWACFRAPSYCEVNCIPNRLDLATGEQIDLPLNDKGDGVYSGIAAAYDITDDGCMIVGMWDYMPAYYIDGDWHALPLPHNSRGYQGFCSGVTPDGKTIIGWIYKGYTQIRPIIWRDGEIVEIGNLPTYDEMYERGIIDRQTYDEHMEKGQTPNMAFFSISADGKTILSGVDHNYPNWGCSYIVYHVDEGTYDWVAPAEKLEQGFVDGASMSPNGEWVSCSVITTRYNADGSWDDYAAPAIYHVPTKTFTTGAGGGIIDNDGVCYHGAIPSLTDGVSVPVDKLLKQKYGIDFTEATGYTSPNEGGGFLFAISADGRTMMGQTQSRLYAYSVTLPIPLKEAASGINLLEDWTCYPPDGTHLSRIEEVRVRFTANATPQPDVFATIMHGDKPVVTSDGAVKGSSGVWTVTFPETVLEADETYTVVLPQGMFRGKNEASISPEIRFNLKGREDKPIAPLSLSPLPESAVMELGAYNMVTMTFDTYPLTTNIPGSLYEKGSQTPLGQLAISADGFNVYAYPPATRRLNQGREYEVVIPAGALTDLMGNCANEEIRIPYRGAFVPEGGKDGKYLFFNDFESPNESLGNFLLYEGDHNPPVNDMQDWGFDADNTPWNFSVRDEENYNYCAASHSRYRNNGASDDWMVLPRLTIDSEHYHLTFKSQSHLLKAQDRLKVIVWESDEIFGSLDKETVDRIKSEGTTVYDELQDIGMTENRLTDEWMENDVDLSRFNGKNVYIAFVNDNENQSAVFIDDIAVSYSGVFLVEPQIPEAVVAADEVDVSVRVILQDDTPWNTVEASWQTEDGLQGGSLEVTSIEDLLEGDDTMLITFPGKMRPAIGSTTRYTVTVVLNGERQSVSGEISNMAYEVTKRVLVEEGTGSWCGYCPQGMIAMDYLNDTYGDRVVTVAVHNGDAYAFQAYDKFLTLGGYPSGRVNRSAEVLSPVSANDATGTYSLTSASGRETFVDMVDHELGIPCFASVDIAGVELTDTRDLTVKVNAGTAIDYNARPMNVLAVVTEDGLAGMQANYLDGHADPLFGEWRGAGDRVAVNYTDVARCIMGTSLYGESGLLPESMHAGESHEVTLGMKLPETINAAKARVTVILIDATSGKAVNSVRTGYLSDISGIGNVISGSDRFSVVNGRVLFNGSAAGVEVYSASGIRLTNGGNLEGLVIVRATDVEGRTHTAKLSL